MDKPPPTPEQITKMIDWASQLHYGFRARPPLGANDRASWEKHFLTTFSRVLKLLAAAEFKYLPPFALCCIWENNRRSHAKDPGFDIERIRDTYDEAHPGRHKGQGKLSYEAAYDGPFALLPESQLKTVWWTQSVTRGCAGGAGRAEEQDVQMAREAGRTDEGVDDNGGHADEDMDVDAEPPDEDLYHGVGRAGDEMEDEGCDTCENGNAGCSLSFKDKSDHCLATYLGYAWYTMVSNPDVYAPPSFSPPSQLPTVLPDKQDIAWFREQYKAQPRGSSARTQRKHSRTAAAAAAVESGSYDGADDDDDALEALNEAAGDNEPQPPAPPATRSIHMSKSRASSVASSGANDDDDPEAPAETSGDDEPQLPAPPASQSVRKTRSRASSIAPSRAASPAVASSSTPADDLAADERDYDVPPVYDDNLYGRLRDYDSPNDDDTAFDRLESPTAEGSAAPQSRAFEVLRPPVKKEINISRIRNELAHASTARAAPPALPSRPPGVMKYVKAPFAVKPIEDTYESLPRLGHQLRTGQYMVVAPPHDDPTPARLASLLRAGRVDSPVLNRLDRRQASPLSPSAARPVTPEGNLFTLPDNVIQLAVDTKAKFDELANLHGQIRGDAEMLRTRAKGFMERHGAAVAALGPAGDALLLDIQYTFSALERINVVLSRLALGFKTVPAVPWNWLVLMELLSKVDELRDLYDSAWQRFDVLEEDVRPVRAEMHRLQLNVGFIQESLDGITNEAVNACEPLLHNVFEHFATRLEAIEQRLRQIDGGAPSPVGPAEATPGQVLKLITSLSERLDRVERSMGDQLRARVEVTVANYLAERGLADDVLRELGARIGYPPRPADVGGSISDAFNTVYPPPIGGPQYGAAADSRTTMTQGVEASGSSGGAVPPSAASRVVSTRPANTSAPAERRLRQLKELKGHVSTPGPQRPAAT
ncbi:hypothetical protein GSI_11220 [Ganoderma sinense ZZ0214-1]|uniref:Uncharacterized protein n=1 Tax=Ganoderma sinense ZZ0214-1 TaxID=1077348 RepID=A0A2G8RYU8_9APHY|nr:hypothetical protein GSI_11220 [Ganoderma sinense ZZ0214-1]